MVFVKCRGRKQQKDKINGNLYTPESSHKQHQCPEHLRLLLILKCNQAKTCGLVIDNHLSWKAPIADLTIEQNHHFISPNKDLSTSPIKTPLLQFLLSVTVASFEDNRRTQIEFINCKNIS